MKVASMVLLAALTSASACHEDEKSDERSLVAAVDRFRAAEDAAEPAALRAIENASCNDGPTGAICSAKNACLLYARPTAAAKTAMAEVKAAIDVAAVARNSMSDAGSLDSAALNAKLQDARKQLDQGHAALDACDHQMQDLRMKYER